MEQVYETQGYYGSQHTACQVFVCSDGDLKWYVVKDSVNVNATYDDIKLGVDVEALSDVDCFTASEPVGSLDEFESLIEANLNDE